ncbi:MAG TPA: DUF998 domain-containing protein [Thermoplasmata archaeon]|nr:DUF998 domain-containing protein [Thermoplasmata archaeon]
MASTGGSPAAPRAAPGEAARSVRAAFTATIALIALYVVLDVIAQLLPPHYSPIRQPESDLAVGPYGYVMTANFVVRGVLSLFFLVGLAKGTRLGERSRTGVALLGVWAVGAFVLAAFPTDVPPTPISGHEWVHIVTALIVFACVAIGEILLSRQFDADPHVAPIRTPAIALSVLALLFAVGFFLGPSRIGGLLERLFLGLALGWMLFVAAYYLYCGRHLGGDPGTSSADASRSA